MTPKPLRGRRNLETARLERVREENRRRAQALELRSRVGVGGDAPAGGLAPLAPLAPLASRRCPSAGVPGVTGVTGPARAAVCRDAAGRGWCVALEITAAGGAERRQLPGSFATLAAAMAAAYAAAAAGGLPLDGIGWG
jgi:hypothetical protein